MSKTKSIYPLIIFFLNTGVICSQITKQPLIQEPELTHSSSCTYPLHLIKKGIQGDVLLDIHISETGEVNKVDIREGVHPILDTLVQQAAQNLTFTPAKTEKDSIPVVLGFQYTFDIKHILKNSEYAPNLTGRVIDKEDKKSIKGLPVICTFIDTTRDTALSISFNEYIKHIAEVPGQYVIENKLITKTDSSGRFNFYLLPACSIKVTLNHCDYPLFKKRIAIHSNKNTDFLFQLSGKHIYSDEKQYEIVVYGIQSTSETINVSEAEIQYGLTNDINNILITKSEINQVPEKGSAILVHGGSIFDNRYEICGVPMFSPSHFNANPNTDISGTMLTTLKDVTCISSNLGGNYSNAVGCAIIMDPGIQRPADDNLIQRAESIVNISLERFDVVFSTPARDSKDFYQITGRFIHTYLLRILGAESKVSYLGYGAPLNFGDVTVTGQNNFNRINLNSHLWFAWDTYNSSEFSDTTTIPWGMGSISIEAAKFPEKFKATAGASRQMYYEGKITGRSIPLKSIERNNATLLVESEKIPLGPFFINCAERVEYLKWKGEVAERSIENVTERDSTTHLQDGEEIHLEWHVGILRERKKGFSYGANVLLGSIAQYKNFFIDPGLWCTVSHASGSFDFSSGIVSSYPDIRGMPDKDYRQEINKTYMVTIGMNQNIGSRVAMSLKPFVRWRDRCPAITPNYSIPIWDKSLETPLYSRGCSYYVNTSFKYVDFIIAGTVGKTNRIKNNKLVQYEWDIPWSIKSNIHVHFLKDWLHLYCNSHVSAGIPYRDFLHENRLTRSGIYIRPDLSIEYHTKEIKHRYITRYDLYIGMRNITGLPNPGDVYWDRNLNRDTLYLTPRSIFFGGRFCFRH